MFSINVYKLADAARRLGSVEPARRRAKERKGRGISEQANQESYRWRGPVSPPAFSEIADREAVRELAKIYALGIDMRDYELCRSAFASEAEVEGRAGAMTAIDVYLPKLFAAASVYMATQHNITNQYVTVTGDEAVLWSYAVAFHKPVAGDSRQSITVGVIYRDRCRRGLEGWLITERRAAIQWTERTASV